MASKVYYMTSKTSKIPSRRLRDWNYGRVWPLPGLICINVLLRRVQFGGGLELSSPSVTTPCLHISSSQSSAAAPRLRTGGGGLSFKFNLYRKHSLWRIISKTSDFGLKLAILLGLFYVHFNGSIIWWCAPTCTSLYCAIQHVGVLWDSSGISKPWKVPPECIITWLHYAIAYIGLYTFHRFLHVLIKVEETIITNTVHVKPGR